MSAVVPDSLFEDGNAPIARLSYSGGLSGELTRKVQSLGWKVVVCDGRRMAAKKGILECFAAVFNFPPYFGHNWDALEDCLTDEDVMGRFPGYAVIVDRA